MKSTSSKARPPRLMRGSAASGPVRTWIRERMDPVRRGIRCGLILATLALVCSALAAADSSSDEAMQSLDEQVQEIKTDVLAIAAELSNLEERLLYPSDTQVAIFVSLAEDESLELGSVQIQIDGELVAHHIYSFKELDALRKGGVQRIFTGNLRTGEHGIEVSIAGKLRGGRDFHATESSSFTKEVGPKIVGIEVASQATGDATIAFGGW